MANPILVFEELAFPYSLVVESLGQTARPGTNPDGSAYSLNKDERPGELHLEWGGIGSGIALRILQMTETSAETEGGPSTSFQLEWAAESASALLPVRKAALVVSPLDRSETRVDFRGDYTPPPGIPGESFDADADRQAAESTVRCLLRFVTEGIEHRIVTRARPNGDISSKYTTPISYEFSEIPDSIALAGRMESGVKLTASQLRALSAKVEAAREDEATRISREIHDQLGSALISIKWELEWLYPRLARVDDLLSEDPLAERVQRMIELLGETVSSVQRISRELRPSTLDKLNLVESIEGEAREFEQRTGIRCTVVNRGEPQLGRRKATVAFRILHECLTNVMRHSSATHVNITTITCAYGFELTVQDDGVGFGGIDFSDPSCLGLLGITERIQSVGGSVAFLDGDDGGALVRIQMRTDERPAGDDPDSAD